MGQSQCHTFDVTIKTSQPRCHKHDVTTTMSQLQCHNHVITNTTSQSQCHNIITMPQCHNDNITAIISQLTSPLLATITLTHLEGLNHNITIASPHTVWQSQHQIFLDSLMWRPSTSTLTLCWKESWLSWTSRLNHRVYMHDSGIQPCHQCHSHTYHGWP